MSLTTTAMRDPAESAELARDLNAALAANDMPRAHLLAERASAAGVEHPLAFYALAHRAEREGRYEDALGLLQRGLELAPSDVRLITATGFIILRLDRRQEAAVVFDTACRIDPTSAPAVYGRGCARMSNGDVEGGRGDWLQAVRLEPGYADALASLGALAAQRGEVEEARSLAERALELEPNQPAARMALARLAFLEGEFQEAEKRLRALTAEARLEPLDRATTRLALGDALDRQGRTNEAFGAYTSGKAELTRQFASRYGASGAETPAAVARRLAAAVEALPTRPAVAGSAAARGSAAAHVFIVGFPTSGEATLDGALRDAGAVVLGDVPLMLEPEAAFVAASDGIDRLYAADEAELDSFRNHYWWTVASQGVDVAGKTFVDRQALNLVRLPVIARLFPDAKILLTLRDPRDVALDCFRTGFAMNATTYQFGGLEGVARYYDAAMHAVSIYRKRLPLAVHEVRYEGLVEDFADEAGRALAFLGLTGPGAEVRPPQGAVGAWRPYAPHVAAVSSLLRPWVERYGYPAA